MKTSLWVMAAITTPLGGLHSSKDCHQRPGRVQLERVSPHSAVSREGTRQSLSSGVQTGIKRRETLRLELGGAIGVLAVTTSEANRRGESQLDV